MVLQLIKIGIPCSQVAPIRIMDFISSFQLLLSSVEFVRPKIKTANSKGRKKHAYSIMKSEKKGSLERKGLFSLIQRSLIISGMYHNNSVIMP